MQDLVAQSKGSKMAYGSNGFATTSHLWIELFKQKTGADMLHVPYKGAAPALQGLLSGEHSLVVASPATLKVQMDAGRVRPIAATSKSARRHTAGRSCVLECATVTVAFSVSSNCATGLPTILERPTMTTCLPSTRTFSYSSIFITPNGVHGG